MSSIIYQYLPLSTFHISIKNKSIRLCNITKSNDYLEKKVYRESLRPAIDEAFQIFGLPLSADTETATGYTFLECMEQEFNNYLAHVTFVSCFSREGDMLSQWRGYANDAEGISIGYDRDILERCFRDDHRFTISDIIYDEEGQVGLLSDAIIRNIFSVQNELNMRSPENLAGYLTDEFEEVLEYMTEDIVPVVCSLKNPAFAEEKETRIVFDPDFPDFYEDDVNKNYTKIQRCERLQMKPVDYFTRNGNLIPFVDINYKNAIDAGIIKRIIIGPKANVEQDELRQYLYFNGFRKDAIEKIKIEKSSLSYR